MRTATRVGCGVYCGLFALVLQSCAATDVPQPQQPLTPQARLEQVRPVSADMLREPAAGDWLQWGRTYDGHNFSPLTRINRENVKNLAPAWTAPLKEGVSMPTPLVHDGVMFLQTYPDTVLAIDATTGTELWRREYTPVGVSASSKMGLALSGGRVIAATSDMHLQSLDVKTGAVVWDSVIAPSMTVRGKPGLRGAPLIVGDKVIQGITSSSVAGGGFIVGLDLATGRELWRFNTIARPGEPGGETWNGLPIEKRSGGSVWHQGTYDRELNLVYYGVAPTYDTGPMLKPSGMEGMTQDALYTDSTIALNPDTGKLVWHYQHVVNDQWDLDWVFERQIVNVKFGGRDRKVVMNVGKVAIVEAVDAATGQYLFSIDAGMQNIITAIDPVTGKKTIDLSRLPDPNIPKIVCPGPTGARSWPPTSYNKSTGILFMPLTESCTEMSEGGAWKLLSAPGAAMSQKDHPNALADGKMGRLQAVDVSGRKMGWKNDVEAPIMTSALATAGGVVFAGDIEPALMAFDDRDGKLLWRQTLDNYPTGSVITYSVGDTQYVAVITGMRNTHMRDMAERYVAFRKTRGLPDPAPTAPPAIQVFKVGK